MVAIAPFRALRYDGTKVDLAKATSPPHDCITDAQRDALLRAEPRNITQVVLNPEQPGDLDQPTAPSRHARAAAFLRKWVADGTLARDARPAFYHYTITHGPAEERRTMSCMFARLLLDPTHKEVLPHEKTLGRKRQDRLHLREATQADCEPIWLLYRDERGWVDELLSSNAFEELARFTDEEGSEHRLWRVDRPEAVGEIVAQFDDRTLVIADGHHRYQTALEHHARSGKPEHGSILVGLVRDNDHGTDVLATHRLLHSLPFGPDEALRRAARHWSVEPLDPADARAGMLPGDERCTILLWGRESWLLQLEPDADIDEARGRLDTLAVTRIHERLLRDAWGIDLAHPEAHLLFTRDEDEAIAAARTGRVQAALLLPPESAHSVLEVASQGQLMPQKSTYFVPKLRSGVVLGPLDEPLPQRWQDIAGDGGKAQWRLPKL